VGSAFGFVHGVEELEAVRHGRDPHGDHELVIGTLFLFGEGSLLPAFFGG
jgi:hypothetical protein